VPPDQHGKLHENDVKSLQGFKNLLDKEFETDLAKGKKIHATSTRGRDFAASNINDGNPETYWATNDHQTAADIIIDLGSETEMNRIILQEYIKLGQRVQEFKVSAFSDGVWTPLVSGTTIGYKVIRKFPVTKASKIKITISKSKACPVISNIELYRSPGQ
jgi:alpha-L-fucosidase